METVQKQQDLNPLQGYKWPTWSISTVKVWNRRIVRDLLNTKRFSEMDPRIRAGIIDEKNRELKQLELPEYSFIVPKTLYVTISPPYTWERGETGQYGMSPEKILPRLNIKFDECVWVGLLVMQKFGFQNIELVMADTWVRADAEESEIPISAYQQRLTQITEWVLWADVITWSSFSKKWFQFPAQERPEYGSNVIESLETVLSENDIDPKRMTEQLRVIACTYGVYAPGMLRQYLAERNAWVKLFQDNPWCGLVSTEACWVMNNAFTLPTGTFLQTGQWVTTKPGNLDTSGKSNDRVNGVWLFASVNLNSLSIRSLLGDTTDKATLSLLADKMRGFLLEKLWSQ